MIVPAGFERFFDELAELLARGADPAEIDAAGARYGHRLHHGWADELERRHRVRVRG